MERDRVLILSMCVPCLLGSVTAWGRQAGASAALIAKLSQAKKPGLGQPLMIGGKEVCGPKGKAGDPQQIQDLNNNKNRSDVPTSYVTIDWASMQALPADKANDIQGAPVSVTGYLSHKVNVEGAESTNCELVQPDEVDWHLYLTNAPNQPISNALIVETTPRVRPAHKWTTATLDKYVNKNQKVRISGWLLYDFEHLDVVGRERAAVWEVHPITKIEVQQGNGWTTVEQ
jgi:hypothetical protein